MRAPSCACFRALATPRVVAGVNAALLLCTVGAFAFLVQFPQVPLCEGLILGSVLVALAAVGGHAMVTVWLLGPAVLRNSFPWEAPAKATAVGGSSSSSSSAQYERLLPDRGDDSDESTAKPPPAATPSFRARPWRILRAALFVLVLVAVALLYSLAVIGLWLTRQTVGDRALSPSSTSPVVPLTFPDLLAPASLSRTDDGVLVVEASTTHDLWFAQGVAHAQTRLWQLDFQRRVGSGRLSEAVGPGGLDVDSLFRTLGTYAAAERDYAAMPADNPARLALEAYADGVNAVLDAEVGASAYLPLEFRVLGLGTPSPWTPPDSLVWGKVMSWDLSGNVDQETSRFGLLMGRGLSRARIDELMPPFDTTRFPTVLSDADLEQHAGRGEGGKATTATAPKELLTAAGEAMLRDLLRLRGRPQGSEGRGDDEGQQAGAAAAVGTAGAAAASGSAGAAAASGSAGAAAASSSPRLDVMEAVERGARAVEVELQKRRRRGGSIALGEIVAGPSASFSARAAGHVLALVTGLGDALLWAVGGGGEARVGAPTSSAQPSSSSSPPSTPARARDARGGVRTTAGGPFRRDRSLGASNNWVVHGNLTSTGKPFLCNDPHLQLMAPSLWQLTALRCPACGVQAVGTSFAGLPGIVIGRNARIAWGVTNTGVDVQDLYVMEEPTQNASSSSGAVYLFDGREEAYAVREEVIKVSGADDVVLRVRVSRHGPVVTDNGVLDSGVDGAVLSLRWVSVDPAIPDTLFGAFHALQTAADYADFRAALALWTAPSQNVVYADVDGNIGYQMPGYVPIRNASAGHTGAYPAPGNSSDFLWVGAWAYDDLPRTLNPPEGFVVSANNQVPPPGFPFLSADWDEGSDGYRARRIRELVVGGGGGVKGAPLTAEDMARIQHDTLSGVGRDVAALVLANLTRGGGGGGGSGLFPTRAGWALAAALADPAVWGGDMGVGSRFATLWGEVLVRLVRLGAPEAGKGVWDNWVFLLNALASDNDGGEGAAQTATVTATNTDPACRAAGFETCLAWAAAAVDSVAGAYGLQANEDGTLAAGALDAVPGWGTDVHFVQMQHQVLHSSPLACVADRTVGHGGDSTSVNVGGFAWSREKGDAGAFTQTAGPSYRQIVDLGDVEGGSLFVAPMGMDGAVFGDAYDELLGRWAGGGRSAGDGGWVGGSGGGSGEGWEAGMYARMSVGA
jgi:acyl-homoserine lactone acylase PvdQ